MNLTDACQNRAANNPIDSLESVVHVSQGEEFIFITLFKVSLCLVELHKPANPMATWSMLGIEKNKQNL